MPAQSLKILHVGSNARDAALFQNALQRAMQDTEHCDIRHVTDCTNALQALSSDHFHAVILTLDGLDSADLQNIKTVKDQAPDSPVVVLTETVDDRFAEDSIKAGAQECLVKSHSDGHILKRVIQSSIWRSRIHHELYQKANYDSLTGLPNRLFFRDMVTPILNRTARRNTQTGLLFIDLDRFKYVNDTYGHEAGDTVLVEVARRLKNILRKSDIVARYAGDEFVICLDHSEDTYPAVTQSLLLAEKIIRDIEKPITSFKDSIICIGCSVGIALYPDAGQTLDDLLGQADHAMYKAKKQPEQSKVRVIEKNDDADQAA